MRILAVSPYYAPEGGGLEQYAEQILGRLAGRGHTVAAVTMTRTGMPSQTRHGVEVQRVDARHAIGNAPVDTAFAAAVRAQIGQHEPDIVVAHTPVPFAAEVAFRAARHADVPFVVTYHAGLLSGSSRALATLATIHRNTIEARMLAKASGLIAVSPFVRDHALRKHRDRVTVIPPGVDADQFPHRSPASGHGILFVAPLSTSYRWKGADVLLKAFDMVRRACPDATLTMVGDGDRRATLAKAHANTGAVRFPGRLSQPYLAAAYNEAAVVVLPSTSPAESFGMVLAEANACGRPVVASRIGGIPDFVEDGHNGLLTIPGDEVDLASKILMILYDEPLANRMGAEGRRKVVAQHDWDHLAMQTEAVFEEVLGRDGRYKTEVTLRESREASGQFE